MLAHQRRTGWRTALATFGNDEASFEKLIRRAHHVEVQIPLGGHALQCRVTTEAPGTASCRTTTGWPPAAVRAGLAQPDIRARPRIAAAWFEGLHAAAAQQACGASTGLRQRKAAPDGDAGVPRRQAAQRIGAIE